MDISPEPLIASLVVSSLGIGLFLYGKRQVRTPQFVAGLLLMVGPYFTESAQSTLGLASLGLVGMLAAIRFGV
jgi:hypothetical protein